MKTCSISTDLPDRRLLNPARRKRSCVCATLSAGTGRILLLVGLFSAGWAGGAEQDVLRREIEALRTQHQEMMQRLQQQQGVIEQMNRKLSAFERTSPAAPVTADKSAAPPPASMMKDRMQNAFGKIHLSGEAAVALFHHQSEGQFPNAEMRIDEALGLSSPLHSHLSPQLCLSKLW